MTFIRQLLFLIFKRFLMTLNLCSYRDIRKKIYYVGIYRKYYETKIYVTYKKKKNNKLTKKLYCWIYNVKDKAKKKKIPINMSQT